MRPPKPQKNNQQDLFRQRLDNLLNMRHELVILADGIDWDRLDDHFGQFFSENGRPAIPSRMMIGLHILKHTYALSDKEVCARWVENPYFQYFCGETFFQHDFPIERSSMTYWRNRVGDESLKTLLQESLMLGLRSKALTPQDLTKITVDTTVQEKAITFPTDAKLHYKAIEKLGMAAKEHRIDLRQSYVRVAKETLIMVQRYRHAKQMKRAKKAMRKLHTYLGRIIRDVDRKAPEMREETILKGVFPGKDGRERVADTTTWPYSIHAHIDINFNGELYEGSGVMTGPQHLRTSSNLPKKELMRVFGESLNLPTPFSCAHLQ